MPIHLFPVAAAAIGYVSARDCDEEIPADENNNNEEEGITTNQSSEEKCGNDEKIIVENEINHHCCGTTTTDLGVIPEHTSSVACVSETTKERLGGLAACAPKDGNAYHGKFPNSGSFVVDESDTGDVVEVSASTNFRFLSSFRRKNIKSNNNDNVNNDYDNNNGRRTSHKILNTQESTLSNTNNVRSIHSERTNASFNHRFQQTHQLIHRSIKLKSAASTEQEEFQSQQYIMSPLNGSINSRYNNSTAFTTTLPDNLGGKGFSIHDDATISGFVQGDFGAAKVKDLLLYSSDCWVMSFSHQATTLAVGLTHRVEFYEPRTLTPVYSLRIHGKVSALSWLEYDNTRELLAIATLTGHVSIYVVEVELMEIQGCQLVHEFKLSNHNAPPQIRCLAWSWWDFDALNNKQCQKSSEPSPPIIVLCVGDKLGIVTMSTLTQHLETIETMRAMEMNNDDSVLSMSMDSKSGIFCLSTKAGHVRVHRLSCHSKVLVEIDPVPIWSTQRNGPVRSIVVSRNGKQLAFGGYDKSLVIVDTGLWEIIRELPLEGTINAIVMDPHDRYMIVGSRDKSLTLYDKSTFFPIKQFHTPGWVTCISWGVPGSQSDLVAVRSESDSISLLDLTCIQTTKYELSSREGMDKSVSWSPNGHYLARLIGNTVTIVDSRYGFVEVASLRLREGGDLKSVAFRPTTLEMDNGYDNMKLAVVGLGGYLYILEFSNEGSGSLHVVQSIFVESNLSVVAWSIDGTLVATGGKGKNLHIFDPISFELKTSGPVKLEGRIIDIEFIKKIHHQGPLSITDGEEPQQQQPSPVMSCGLAVATGDYKMLFFDAISFEPTLQVVRARSVRCLTYHPKQSLLAIGDGAGIVAIVDYVAEETMNEFSVGGRVNSLAYSPAGDYLLVGTDDCQFLMYETRTYKAVQVVPTSGFALCASFSSNGKYLALGSVSGPYCIVRLGPLLSVDLVPLTGASELPKWALNETLYRSNDGPSLLQRQMMRSGQESVQWISEILREHPNAIFALDRCRNEGCITTALRLRRLNLLKLAVTTLVDGSLEADNCWGHSIVTTTIPEVGRKTLVTMLEHHPPEFVVEILKEMTFVKVPFTKPHSVSRDDRMECASSSYLDPWLRLPLAESDSVDDEGFTYTRIPALLPLPGLGTLGFLSSLVLKAPPTAFDNEAMGLVLRVMWRNHIRKYFIFDISIFMIYYCLWILLVDSVSASSERFSTNVQNQITAAIVLVLNTLFGIKEVVQSDLGKRQGYFFSIWNIVDILSMILVYTYSILTVVKSKRTGTDLIPLAVITTLLLTMKLLSYLRAFHDTGWLVTVLTQNFRDVKGFLVVLLAILVGFATSFRLLFADNPLPCEIEIDSQTNTLVEDCESNPFGSLRRSLLSTFELTILGAYEPSLLYDSEYTPLAILTFIFAVTCVLVVALNALISLLADSYARVQENATANRRKEKAELIVEYLTLLPRWKRKRIEEQTKYFHALLEADADGDLVVSKEDWRGGLNALRNDLQEFTHVHCDSNKRLVEQFHDLETELTSVKKELVTLLQDLSRDVRKIQKIQNEGGITFNGKRVAGAVKAVKEIGRIGLLKK